MKISPKSRTSHPVKRSKKLLKESHPFSQKTNPLRVPPIPCRRRNRIGRSHAAALPQSSPAPAQKPAQNAADFFSPPESADKTTRGSAIFWGCFILGFPIIFAALALIIALFGLCYIALIGAIIGFVLALIAIVAVGCGVSLVGIIYGITQLFSFVAAGVYEIGLGVMIAGMVLFAAVLLYNAAVRFLPWVMRWLTVFFGFVFGKLRQLFYVVRRECYKL